MSFKKLVEDFTLIYSRLREVDNVGSGVDTGLKTQHKLTLYYPSC